jgi:LmbE family N-acetylglucosaminyl deacetylase
MMNQSFSEVYWSVFVEAGVSAHAITVVLLGLGELGIPDKSGVTPHEMSEIRETEFTQAMSVLGLNHEILRFPDTQLRSHFETLVYELLKLMRVYDFDEVISFHPAEYTPQIDHPDHTAAGAATREAASFVDVKHKYPELPAPHRRPGLWLWTTNKHLATHKVNFNKKVQKYWNEYLFRQYPSQFKRNEQREVKTNIFKPIFQQTAQAKKRKSFRTYLTHVR